MQSPIGRSPLRDVWSRRRGVRRRCTWRIAFSSVDTYKPSSPLLMDFSGWRRRLPLKGYPVTSHQSGSNPNRRRVDTSRVGLPSLWCGPHTGVSEDQGYLHTKSVCRDRNGKTGLDWRCSGKSSPNQINTSPQTNPPTPPNNRVQTAEKPKRLKGRRWHRGHPKGGIQAPGSPQRLTIQHQGGTGYTCPTLMLIE